ncbi:MAG: hypothetical protein IPH07_21015 [Deltaproteobacteria bacterium]|nr:hypothetical protein [Deltaproteobacteria bacterium]MBK8239827.1 hypothetical protein [Deltaproteobacteria bacterium]MBP7289442.1 hypothetical protein [Nannocystaceae bacterium]
MKTRNGFGFLMFGILGFAMSQIGACERDGTGDLRVHQSCKAYCQQAASCDDDVDEDDCISRCENTVDDCMADEQEQALDDLDVCSDETCDEVASCTIGAGLQCAFGL